MSDLNPIPYVELMVATRKRIHPHIGFPVSSTPSIRRITVLSKKLIASVGAVDAQARIPPCSEFMDYSAMDSIVIRWHTPADADGKLDGQAVIPGEGRRDI